MPLLNPYCSLQDLQDELKNEDADSDAVVQTRHEAAVNRASRMVDDYCHRDFLFHDHTSTPLPIRQRWVVANHVYLPWPVITLSAVEIDDVVQDADDYRYIVGDREVYLTSVWPVDKQDKNFIEFTGTFGYAQANGTTSPPTDTAFPEYVRRATVLIASRISGDYRKEHMNEQGQVNSLLTTDIPMEARALLHRHRLHLYL